MLSPHSHGQLPSLSCSRSSPAPRNHRRSAPPRAVPLPSLLLFGILRSHPPVRPPFSPPRPSSALSLSVLFARVCVPFTSHCLPASRSCQPSAPSCPLVTHSAASLSSLRAPSPLRPPCRPRRPLLAPWRLCLPLTPPVTLLVYARSLFVSLRAPWCTFAPPATPSPPPWPLPLAPPRPLSFSWSSCSLLPCLLVRASVSPCSLHLVLGLFAPRSNALCDPGSTGPLTQWSQCDH